MYSYIESEIVLWSEGTVMLYEHVEILENTREVDFSSVLVNSQIVLSHTMHKGASLLFSLSVMCIVIP